MSFTDTQENTSVATFAEGWTAFLTVAGLDLILRTSAGEAKGRLSEIDADGNLVGTMHEPGDNPALLELVVRPVSEEELSLTCGKRKWTLTQPAGKEHFFAFLQQWPKKAEPASSVKAMLAALRKK